MSEPILTNLDQGVLTLVLNRPEKKNALTDAMYRSLHEGIERAAADPTVRVVLIRAEGSDFSAGNDIGDFAQIATGQRRAEDMAVFHLLLALARFEKPVVAAVKGLAVGIGTTLLLHCDLAYAAEDARLSTPFATLALTPEAASSLLLPRLIGHARAYAMFALGEAMDGRQAAAVGLVNAALPAAEVDAAAQAAALRLAKAPAAALKITKRLMRDGEVVAQLMQREAALFAERLVSPEAGEAFAAFAQRRPADFSRFD